MRIHVTLARLNTYICLIFLFFLVDTSCDIRLLKTTENCGYELLLIISFLSVVFCRCLLFFVTVIINYNDDDI